MWVCGFVFCVTTGVCESRSGRVLGYISSTLPSVCVCVWGVVGAEHSLKWAPQPGLEAVQVEVEEAGVPELSGLAQG